MCTVLLRFAPDERWPLLVAAIRDEFLDRPWDPPGAHWPTKPNLVGGRDRTAGGTWLAVRRDDPAVAALLNGVRLPVPASGQRPTRGELPLAALTGTAKLEASDLADYDGFHLMLGTPTSVRVWSWDGTELTLRELPPGDHIIVNLGVDTVDDPLVPHLTPLLAATPAPPLPSWGEWVSLLRGDGRPGDDPRALLVRREFEDRVYGSSSASLVAIARDEVRFDFTPTPTDPHWSRVL